MGKHKKKNKKEKSSSKSATTDTSNATSNSTATSSAPTSTGTSSAPTSTGTSSAPTSTGTSSAKTSASSKKSSSKKVSKKPSSKSASKKSSKHSKSHSSKGSKTKSSKKKEKNLKAGMKFAMNAESMSPADPEVINHNQEQIDMIVALLETVSTDFVTIHIKQDLDRVQTMVRNITYREAGEHSQVKKVHFTDAEKAVILQVCGKQDAAQESALTNKKLIGYVPVLTYPYVKLKLVPTRLSPATKSKVKIK